MDLVINRTSLRRQFLKAPVLPGFLFVCPVDSLVTRPTTGTLVGEVEEEMAGGVIRRVMGQYDIIIIGGGMVGATLALSLRQSLPSTLSMGVVEAVDMPAGEEHWQPSYDARSTALSEGARRIFTRLNIWDAIRQQVEPISDIHVSDRGHFGVTRLNAKEHRVPALGYVVDNSWLGHTLMGAVQQTDGIDWICPAKVKSLQPSIEGGEVGTVLETDHPELGSLRARLVVLADGGRSGLAASIGITSDDHHYEQKAIVANVTPAEHHQNRAFERFTDEGPMALLPRQGGDCALVWTMPEALADERLQLVDDDFLQELQDRFGHRLGRFNKVGERFSYPLVLRRSREQVRPGLVIFGNAAHSLHPVAGQGFNLSLRDVEGLTKALVAAAGEGKSPGGFPVLQAYAKERENDQHQTIDFSDQVVRLFTSKSLTLAGARNLGLVGMDLVFPLRDKFARQAMGLK